MTKPNMNPILDRIIAEKRLKNDAALSRLLETPPPVISKLRHNKLPIGPATILTLVELGGIPLEDIRTVVPRKRFGDDVTAE